MMLTKSSADSTTLAPAYPKREALVVFPQDRKEEHADADDRGGVDDLQERSDPDVGAVQVRQIVRTFDGGVGQGAARQIRNRGGEEQVPDGDRRLSLGTHGLVPVENVHMDAFRRGCAGSRCDVRRRTEVRLRERRSQAEGTYPVADALANPTDPAPDIVLSEVGGVYTTFAGTATVAWSEPGNRTCAQDTVVSRTSARRLPGRHQTVFLRGASGSAATGAEALAVALAQMPKRDQ